MSAGILTHRIIVDVCQSTGEVTCTAALEHNPLYASEFPLSGKELGCLLTAIGGVWERGIQFPIRFEWPPQEQNI